MIKFSSGETRRMRFIRSSDNSTSPLAGICPANQTGIPALRDERGPRLVADLLQCARPVPSHPVSAAKRSLSMPAAAPFGQMRRDLARIFAPAGRAGRGFEPCRNVRREVRSWRFSRGGRAAQAVIDGFAEPGVRNRHDRDLSQRRCCRACGAWQTDWRLLPAGPHAR